MRSRKLLPSLLPRLPKPTDLSAQIHQRSNLSAQSCHDATESGAAADPARAVSLLAERSWFERINSEFAASLLQLGPRFVVRALQHAAAEPLLCVRLYVWASRFGQHFARDRAVRRALGDALWPPALLRSIQDSLPPALPCSSATSRLQLLSSQILNATTLRQLA